MCVEINIGKPFDLAFEPIAKLGFRQLLLVNIEEFIVAGCPFFMCYR
ncbi:MAG: hypothetical protein MJE68_14490 [Proteobacteria bacterium]|nr:hypothetical protein [Pseudomonadota bacterium]